MKVSATSIFRLLPPQVSSCYLHVLQYLPLPPSQLDLMKLASFLTFASFAVSAAFAATLEIGYPTPNTCITPGQNLTVQLLQPVRIL